MKKFLFVIFLFFDIDGFCQTVPTTISYQGYLEENNVPVNGQARIFTFDFYTKGGAFKASRSVSATPAKGLFNVIIGEAKSLGNEALPTHIWGEEMKVKVTVTNPPNPAVPLGEFNFTTAPYAFSALHADSVKAENIYLGSGGVLPNTVLDTDLQDLALDSELSDARLEPTLDRTGFNATGNISAGGNLSVVGTITGNGSGLVGINASAIGNGDLNLASGKFSVNGTSGNLSKINNVNYFFPSTPGAAGAYLRNDDTNGNLSWSIPVTSVNSLTGGVTLVAGTNISSIVDTGGNTLTINAEGGVDGSGTSGQISFWNGPNSLGINPNLTWDNANYRLGIGTTTPVSSLDVEGGMAIGTTYSGTTSSPANGAIIEGIVGIGTNAPAYGLDIASAGTFTSSERSLNILNNYSGINNSYIFRGNSNSNGNVEYGLYMEGEDFNYFSGRIGIGTNFPGNPLHILTAGTDASSASPVNIENTYSGGNTKYGIVNTVTDQGTGFRRGIFNSVSGNAGSGLEVYGIHNSIWPNGSGTTYGTYNDIQSTGSTNRFGTYNKVAANNNSEVFGEHNEVSNSGTGNVYGFSSYMNKPAATGGTVYGININAQHNGTGDSYVLYGNTTGTTSGIEYGLYVAGENRNYFSGNVGIGTPTPGQKLDVNGTVNATAFTGSGVGLADLNGTNITSGTVNDSRLETTIDRTILNASDYVTAVGGLNVGASADPNGNLMVTSGMLIVGSHTVASFSVDVKSPLSATTAVVRIDKTAAAGASIVDIYRSGFIVGNITESSGTVSYNSFTGSHLATCAENPDVGSLVSMTGRMQRIAQNSDSEPVYEVIVSRTENDSKILGSFLHNTEEKNFENKIEGNIRTIMAVGNGFLWIADNGEEIKVGDYLISSSITGHGIKDNKKSGVSYVIARAAENINWVEVAEIFEGRKHKKISVFFENFIINYEAEETRSELLQIKSELELLKEKLKTLDALLNNINHH